jgi:predicted nucleic acid-binding protein
VADLFTAVLDTATLYPASLRDTLLLCAERDLFVPQWSAETLDELARVLVRTGRMSGVASERLVSELRTSFDAATVDVPSGLAARLDNHPKDRHVLAAAVVSKADVIVTPNVRDFTGSAVAGFGIEVMPPDDFLLGLFSSSPDAVRGVIDVQWRALRRPPLSRDQVLSALAVVAPRFVAVVRDAPGWPSPQTER